MPRKQKIMTHIQSMELKFLVVFLGLLSIGSLGLDLVAMVEQRGLPDFFLTLSAHDGWPQVQATLREGWGAVALDTDTEDLAAKVSDRQPVGWHPEVSVLAAEKRYRWLINLLKSDNGPLGQIQELVVKRVPKTRGHTLAHACVGEAWHSTSPCSDGRSPQRTRHH